MARTLLMMTTLLVAVGCQPTNQLRARWIVEAWEEECYTTAPSSWKEELERQVEEGKALRMRSRGATDFSECRVATTDLIDLATVLRDLLHMVRPVAWHSFVAGGVNRIALLLDDAGTHVVIEEGTAARDEDLSGNGQLTLSLRYAGPVRRSPARFVASRISDPSRTERFDQAVADFESLRNEEFASFEEKPNHHPDYERMRREAQRNRELESERRRQEYDPAWRGRIEEMNETHGGSSTSPGGGASASSDSGVELEMEARDIEVPQPSPAREYGGSDDPEPAPEPLQPCDATGRMPKCRPGSPGCDSPCGPTIMQ